MTEHYSDYADIGRIVVNMPKPKQPQWVESGANLPAVRPQVLPQVLPEIAPQFPSELPPQSPPQFPAITGDLYKELVIKVSHLVNAPMQSLRILDMYQRVFLVEFVPHEAVDPILPVTLLPLGRDHDNAYSWLSDTLLSWNPRYTDQRSFFMQCKRYAKICIMAAFEHLDRDEAEYYGREMTFTMANPDRRNLNVPAQQQRVSRR